MCKRLMPFESELFAIDEGTALSYTCDFANIKISRKSESLFDYDFNDFPFEGYVEQSTIRAMISV